MATQINEADEREKQRHLTSASENAKWSTTDVVTGDTTALFIQIQMKYNQTPTRLPEIVVFALKNRLEVSATRLLKFEILPSAEMEEASFTEPEIESSQIMEQSADHVEENMEKIKLHIMFIDFFLREGVGYKFRLPA